MISYPDYLPPAFADRMKALLGSEADAFFESYQRPRSFGLRVNTAKISCAELEALAPFALRRIPWTGNGFFYDEAVRPSTCPLYQAGLYYLQEPSAMTPASRLPIEPGDYVLDLCAAPGGKATALGAALNGSGFLLANDISSSRARALLRNLELFGIPNALVTSEPVPALAERFPAFFDKILLDAPCSGEGMFRKEEAIARDWSPQKSDALAKLQRELLLCAADLLAPGGMLLYSTCTFSPQEDEGAVAFVLENRPELFLVPIEGYEGFSPGILPEPRTGEDPSAGRSSPDFSLCVRIFPHRMEGEGHFLALMKKEGTRPVREPASGLLCLARSKKQGGFSRKNAAASLNRPDKEESEAIRRFMDEIGLVSLGGRPFDYNRLAVFGERVYVLPEIPLDTRGLHFLRYGLYLGDLKKNRFEPSQPFALALHRGDAARVISLDVPDVRLQQYLRGESIPLDGTPGESQSGWQILAVSGYPIGFGKAVNGTLKNKLPAGWRTA